MQPRNWRKCRCTHRNVRALMHIQNKGSTIYFMVSVGAVQVGKCVCVHGDGSNVTADESGADALPLQVLRSGCRVKPTGQLQRTPVTESWHVLSQPPLFTAQVSAGKQVLTVRPTLWKCTPQTPSWPISFFPQKRHTCTLVLHQNGREMKLHKSQHSFFRLTAARNRKQSRVVAPRRCWNKEQSQMQQLDEINGK